MDQRPSARASSSSEATTVSTPRSRRSRSSSSWPSAASPAGCEHQHRDPRLHERDRAVAEVRRGVRIREDPRQLLELERPLARRGVLEAAPDDDAAIEAAGLGGEGRRDPLDGRLEGERRLDLVGDRGERLLGGRVGIRGRATAGRSRAATSCRSWSRRSPARGRRRARGRARRPRASALAGSFVIASVGAPWRRAAATTDDDVGRGARLADPDDERPPEARLGAVERDDRRRREPDREAVPHPEDVLGVDRGVVRGSPRRDHDGVDAVLAEARGERARAPSGRAGRAGAGATAGCSTISSWRLMRWRPRDAAERAGGPGRPRRSGRSRRTAPRRAPSIGLAQDRIGRDVRRRPPGRRQGPRASGARP